MAVVAGAVISSLAPRTGPTPPSTGETEQVWAAIGPATGRSGDPPRTTDLELRIAAHPLDLASLIELGHAYLASRRLEQAEEVTLRALALDSLAPEAHAHAGMLMLASGVPDTALQAEDIALRLDSTLSEAWLYRGMILFLGLRDYRGAVAAWERYLGVTPPGPRQRTVENLLSLARAAVRK